MKTRAFEVKSGVSSRTVAVTTGEKTKKKKKKGSAEGKRGSTRHLTGLKGENICIYMFNYHMH